MTSAVPLPEIHADDLPDRPASGLVRVAAAQTAPRIGEIDANIERAATIMAQAAERGAGVVIFTECALTGYCFADADEARRLALPREHTLQELAQACARHQVVCLIGYLERDGDDLANTAAVIGAQGVVARYRKTHLPYLGVDRWVCAGDEPLQPVDTAGIQTGVLICYDLSFPEASRTLTLRGAELIAVPTNWPQEAVLKAEWLPNARAYENVTYVAAVNRVGEERGYLFHGRSRICDPTGKTVVQGPTDTEALLITDMDPARARQKRIQRRGAEYWVDRIGHRRPDLYDPRLIHDHGDKQH